ncbi:hypothetical protein D6851_01105 [Altericroceibacterium spongiae]|uniref:Uncharacterized protein n=1 Tax=Altericroceibacterium spongiae TaxID=2320269 RepID=A0A420ER14_9SPHN|nr:hypothetical protein [Altericroceibacterium spongiae]RKF23124.1 hypothetical protein D6851_01105 [Altericroceibacterium spongiae]
MTDHPSTYNGGAGATGEIDWDDRASIHLKDDGRGLLDSMKGLYRGTLAEMVRHVMQMPETERGNYVIQKAGDHRLDLHEIAALAARPDFPG